MYDVGFDYHPFLVASCFYISVFIFAELTRKLIDRSVAIHGLLYITFMEAIATAQMCACVYENAVIVRHYGLMGFFFTVTSLLLVGGVMNRGAYVSPLLPLEMFLKGTLMPQKLFSILVGETVGGYAAYRIARNLWYWSLNLAEDHAFFYRSTHCTLNYKVPFTLVVIFEIVGCFMMRTILFRIPPNSKKYLAPTVVSAFLTSALLFIGVAGLNPTVASSRLQGCEGLNTVWFILTYWICPIIGWMLSAFMDDWKTYKNFENKMK